MIPYLFESNGNRFTSRLWLNQNRFSSLPGPTESESESFPELESEKNQKESKDSVFYFHNFHVADACTDKVLEIASFNRN